jgi:hypothetical protein
VPTCPAKSARANGNARAADLANRRGDTIDDELRDQLTNLRYLDLATVIEQAWRNPVEWADNMQRLYAAVAIDPLSTVASTLRLDFDTSNDDYCAYHDRLIKPLIDRGMVVLQADNIGHALEAKSRAKGASAKQDKADVVLACSLRAGPALSIKAMKVRSVRAPFRRGDTWIFDRATQRTTAASAQPEAASEAFRPTKLMENVSRVLETEPGLTRNGVRAAVKGKASYVDLALELLVAEGYVDAEQDGQAKHHRSLMRYRVPESQPGPNRVPDVDRAERLLDDHADIHEVT